MTGTYIPSEAESRPSLPADKIAKFEYWKQRLHLNRRSWACQVLEFMVAFDQLPMNPGGINTVDDLLLAEKLMQEEIGELSAGFSKFKISQSLENAVEFADGAIDSIYVILWSLNKLGFPADELFAEVQRSNMAKLLPDGSYTKSPLGKVVKPESWTPPNLLDILIRHRDPAIWNGNMRVGDKT